VETGNSILEVWNAHYIYSQIRGFKDKQFIYLKDLEYPFEVYKESSV